jgi:Skp family chaperone for outer membrane proteins
LIANPSANLLPCLTMKSFFLALAFAAVTLRAAAPNIGVVDAEEVMKKYGKAVAIQGEIQKSKDAAQAAINERGKEVEGMIAELQAIQKRGQSPLLSEAGKKSVQAELQSKSEVFQQRRGELEKFIQEANATIQQRQAEMTKTIGAEVRAEVEKISKVKSLQLVLPKGVSLYTDASLDITDEVIKVLNDGYKPAPAPVAPAAPAAPVAPAGDKPAAK